MRPFLAFNVGIAVVALAGLHLEVMEAAQSGKDGQKARVDQHGDPLPDGATARLGTTRYRHGGMDLLGFTPDGKALIYQGSGALHFMDVASGKHAKVVQYGEPEARGIRRFGMESQSVLSADGKVLAYSSFRGSSASITVIDAVTGKERKQFTSADLFKNPLPFFDPPSLALNDDGKWLLVSPTGFDNGPGGGRLPLQWFDSTTGQRLHEVSPDKDCRFLRAQFSRDGRHVLAAEFNDRGNGSAKLRIIDAVRGADINVIELKGNPGGFRFEPRPDGQTLLLASGQGGPIRLYDFTAGKELKEIRAFSEMQYDGSFAQSRDGKHLFITGRNKIHHWDIETGKEIRQIEVTGMPQDDFRFGGPFGRSGGNALAVSHDGKQLAFSAAHSAMVFDAATGKQIAGGSAAAAISAVRFAPDGKGLIVANSDHAVALWDTATAKVAKTFASFEKFGRAHRHGMELFTTFVGNAAFSEDGKLLAVGLGERGVGVWDAGSGATLKRYGPDKDDKKEFIGPESMPFAFAFAPRGNTLAVAAPNGLIKLWDAAAAKPLRSWNWHTVSAPRPEFRMEAAMLSLAFSPDGKTLAGCGVYNMMDGIPQTTIILWEAATGKERLRLRSQIKGRGPDDFDLEMIFSVFDQMGLSAAFSPDGKHLIVGTFSGLHIVDAFTGKDVVSYSGRQMIGRTATFSHDGKLLFVGRTDGSLRVLDAATGHVVRDVPAHSEAILSLTLSGDGKTLASGSSDSTVLLWDVAALPKEPAASKQNLSPQVLQALWADLAGGDGVKAYQAINSLAVASTDSVPFLKSRLKAIAPLDQKLLEQLIEDLNNPKFPSREKASASLEKLGDLAGPALKAKLAAKPPLEVQQRIEKLLTKLNSTVENPESLQALRGIEALERIGGPEALAVLADLAKGAPGHRLTEDASASVQRLQNQYKKK